MTTLQIPRFGAQPVPAVFTIDRAPGIDIDPIRRRVSDVLALWAEVLRVECEYDDGDSVSLTLAFLRKHGVPAGWSCKGGEHGRSAP